jgi:transposase
MPAGLVMRAKIVLAAAEGARTGEIVQRVGVSKPTVIAWRNRYLAEGIGGLDDRAKAGRPRQIDEVAIVQATLDPRLGVTHWSTRLLGAHLGVSNYTVAKAWQRWGLKPWRRQTFKFSTDPELEAKIRDVVGLYLERPEKAVVLCVDEKSQIQALDRTAPILPLRPGLPEKGTHDYRRHGTTTLFAALEVATGKVTDACYPRHRSDEFLRFLKLVAKTLPAGEITCRGGQLRRAQTPEGERVAGPQPADHPALHPDVRVPAEHGRDLLRDHHPSGHPPRHVHLGA